MASATLDYNASLVTNAVTTQRAKFDWCAQNAHVFNDSIIELAESLLETDGADQSEGAKAAIKELLDIETEAKAFAHALTSLQSTYAPSERTTDFAQNLSKGTKRMLPVVRGAADMKQYYEEACSRLAVEDEQEEEEKLGSDDEICIGGSHAAAANVACPLSGKPLMEIEDPVEDQAGYVYERYIVEKYIKENQGSVECPVSATHHIITIAGLKRAHKVIRQQRHQKIHGTQQQSQAEVFDVDD